MSNAFVEQEVAKIITENTDSPKNLALATAWILANYKGINIKVIDAKESSSLCDFNIITTAQNTNQARTMVDELTYNLKKHGMQNLSTEGLTEGDWILLDMGEIIIHIFQEHTREIFDLDGLWKTWPTLSIPQEYYFSHPEIEQDLQANTDPTDGFF